MCVCVHTPTGVCPAVCLQVGAFGVHFVAPGKVTAVNPPLLQRVGGLGRDGVLRARVNYHGRVVAPGKNTQQTQTGKYQLEPDGGAASQQSPAVLMIPAADHRCNLHQQVKLKK